MWSRPRETSSRPKLLIVNHLLPHYRKDVFRNLQESADWDVHFAAGTTSRDGNIEHLGDRDLRNVRMLRNIWVGPILWQKGLITHLLRRWDHIIFLGDAAYLSTWVAAVVARLLGSQVSFWTIGWHRPDRGPKKFVRLGFYRLAEQLLLYGRHGHALGVSMKYPSHRMHVIGNSSSEPPAHLTEKPSDLRTLRQALNLVPHPAVGAVIRLNPHKSLETIIAAAAYLQNSGGPIVSVVLAGSGPATDVLRTSAQEQGVDLHLVGPIYGNEALRLFYEKCSVSVIPTLAGLTVLQSLKFGRPVVTHDNPDFQMPEYEAIVPGLNGALYTFESIPSLATCIRDWVERVSESPLDVAQKCTSSLNDFWNPESHAQTILAAIDRKDQH